MNRRQQVTFNVPFPSLLFPHSFFFLSLSNGRFDLLDSFTKEENEGERQLECGRFGGAHWVGLLPVQLKADGVTFTTFCGELSASSQPLGDSGEGAGLHCCHWHGPLPSQKRQQVTGWGNSSGGRGIPCPWGVEGNSVLIISSPPRWRGGFLS